jgi:hypothetical protein
MTNLEERLEIEFENIEKTFNTLALDQMEKHCVAVG